MFDCQSTSKLVSKSLDTKLSAWQRFCMYLHLRLCSGCRRYHTQLTSFNTLFDRLRSSSLKVRLSDERKQQIKQSITTDRFQ